jgi:golgi apparatus membrane protein TVP38
MSICGFAYGIKGIIIVAPGALIGSLVTFIVFRRFLQSRLKIWSHQNKKWQAMEHVIVGTSISFPFLTLLFSPQILES